MPNDRSTPTTRVLAGNRNPAANRGLAPAASFSDVLKDLSVNDEGVDTWVRPTPPRSNGTRPYIKFQSIDITESSRTVETSELHLFGVTKAGYSILTRVLGFEHYFYYPAPSGLLEADLEPLCNYANALLTPSAIGRPSNLPIQRIELGPQKTTSTARESPYLRIYLSNHNEMDRLPIRIFNSAKCQYRNLFRSRQGSCEAQVPYHLRFMVDTGINAMSWLKLAADKYEVVPEAKRISICQLEVSIQYDDEHIMLCSTPDNRELFAPLRILSFDIETHVPPSGAFPTAVKDSVIQIGNMVSTFGQTNPSIRVVFTVDSCSPIDGAQVQSFKTETDMLLAWKKFILEVDPDIITGYNITKFDIPYILNRASALGLTQFPYLGRLKSWRQVLSAPFAKIDQFSDCPGYNGRLLLDVFNHIRDNYPDLRESGKSKLNNVSKMFLGDQKEDLPYNQIPVLQSGNADTRRTLAIYCLKDTYLPLRLLTKLECLEKEIKAAKEAHVPFNAMRERSSLKRLSQNCRNAIARDYILVDPREFFKPEVKTPRNGL
ncbi:hypothetical protein CVT25_004327 [Psilocybe cyanescens]|uniref:DNA polymerase delta catalytic subunit n=1 Tax=Psilocybe cyanescens TaxID=93625 RepID=A0A409XPX4_PSICY|nr:hypothetical protein CVT25_004327 [Psilocybe cyanescens]